jgi:hypothetical protein
MCVKGELGFLRHNDFLPRALAIVRRTLLAYKDSILLSTELTGGLESILFA